MILSTSSIPISTRYSRIDDHDLRPTPLTPVYADYEILYLFYARIPRHLYTLTLEPGARLTLPPHRLIQAYLKLFFVMLPPHLGLQPTRSLFIESLIHLVALDTVVDINRRRITSTSKHTHKYIPICPEAVCCIKMHDNEARHIITPGRYHTHYFEFPSKIHPQPVNFAGSRDGGQAPPASPRPMGAGPASIWRTTTKRPTTLNRSV